REPRLALRRAPAGAVHRQRRDDRLGRPRAPRGGRRARPARRLGPPPLAARPFRRAGPRGRGQGVSALATGPAIGPAIGVVGAGAWGTALAQMLAADGNGVLLWAREPELVEEINRQHTNSLFLPSTPLANSIRATGDLSELARCEVLLL